MSDSPEHGGIDRHRDPGDLRFEQFLAGSVGSAAGLGLATDRGRPEN